MDIEVSAEAKDKSLNQRVAITVVLLSVFMGLGNIKDGNIVQAMAQSQANSVDRWNEYQAARTKGRLADTARTQIAIIAGSHPSPAAATAIASLARDVAHYTVDAPRLSKQATGFAADYDALNIHDDQFDASEALISTAISVAAVASLVESAGVLWLAWAFGAFGIFMGVCGFAGWGFHPDVLSNFLG